MCVFVLPLPLLLPPPFSSGRVPGPSTIGSSPLPARHHLPAPPRAQRERETERKGGGPIYCPRIHGIGGQPAAAARDDDQREPEPPAARGIRRRRRRGTEAGHGPAADAGLGGGCREQRGGGTRRPGRRCRGRVQVLHPGGVAVAVPAGSTAASVSAAFAALLRPAARPASRRGDPRGEGGRVDGVLAPDVYVGEFFPVPLGGHREVAVAEPLRGGEGRMVRIVDLWYHGMCLTRIPPLLPSHPIASRRSSS